MGVPTSEVGYTSAMPRRADHRVHKDMWGHWGGGHFGKTISLVTYYITSELHAYKKGKSIPHLQLDSNMSQIIFIGRM